MPSAIAMSHPTWVRGLKQNMIAKTADTLSSHPTWVRGLKLFTLTLQPFVNEVAPYVGAWIETQTARKPMSERRRTLRGCVD